MAEAEIEEERIEREETIEEDVFEEEFQVAERENTKGESSISREIALKSCFIYNKNSKSKC